MDLAIASRVDFVLVAGDAFENERQTLTGQLRFRDGLARLGEQGIRSFIVTGNHDPLSGWAGSVAYPEASVHRFGADPDERVPVLRDGVEIARIHGRSYPRKVVTENYAAGFRRELVLLEKLQRS